MVMAMDDLFRTLSGVDLGQIAIHVDPDHQRTISVCIDGDDGMACIELDVEEASAIRAWLNLVLPGTQEAKS